MRQVIDSVIMPGAVIRAGAVVRRAIVAENAVVGYYANVGGAEGEIAVVGPGVRVPDHGAVRRRAARAVREAADDERTVGIDLYRQ